MNRAERRRQLKLDERAIRSGLDASRLDGREVISLMRVLRDRLRVCIERRSVSSLMHFIYCNLNDGTKHLADVPIACRKGCSHCCHIWVDASPPEIFYAVKTMHPDHKRSAVVEVEEACAITQGKSFDDRGQLVTPCPLLQGDLCGVYEARPINCRTAVSADSGVCERSYLQVSGEDIPTPFVWMALRQGYGVALEGAMVNAGLASENREWNEALKLTLADPDIEARWLAGEDVFRDVARVEEPGFLQQPNWQEMYRAAFG